ncbi:origin recognition complex protein 6 [Artemisia annua]|uniref:Origin recognition complex protein 6 n=1 Tax=Artemisia annua TaxID=35608 RepID=A0A2U1N997_ARTAN|nr:origin recognition complex protein 6 [Artemisia annua]PWA76851.1 origin recognition complex protein 6 [Artemisia annua]
MDLSELASKLGLSEPKQIIRKAAELRRMSDLQFDSSNAGIGEICKAVICLEIAANMKQALFDRQTAIRLSGMSEKAYIRSFNVMQNGIGIKNTLDIRELGIQFGCVRLIPLVQKGLKLYRERFTASLPPTRRASADFSRPVFTATGFYLCAKKHKLKVDKSKLIELSGSSEDEFSSVSTSMKDLCFDVFGVEKEKKDPKTVKGNRDLLDAIPEKRQDEDGGYSSDEGKDLSAYKKRKRQENHKYEEWKSTVVESNKQSKEKVAVKKTKQAQLNFFKRVPGTEVGAT